MLNSTIPDYFFLTFRVINGKESRDVSKIGCFPVMEHMDKFNSCFIVPYTQKDKYVAKQDAAYSSPNQTTGKFQSQFNFLWSMFLSCCKAFPSSHRFC